MHIYQVYFILDSINYSRLQILKPCYSNSLVMYIGHIFMKA